MTKPHGGNSVCDNIEGKKRQEGTSEVVSVILFHGRCWTLFFNPLIFS